MGKGIFVTGTDTGVGKTIITASLVSLLIKEGLDVGVMKPIETGCPKRNGGPVPRDATFLKVVSGSKDDLSLINPYRFSKPLAPLIAAEIDQKKINLEKISSAYKRLRKRHDLIFVEGAGGLLVPLTRKLTNLDLILKLDLPIIVVVGSRLGAVNHTLLTLSWAKENGAKIIGLLINQPNPRPSPRTSLVEETNPRLIRSFTEVPILGEVPYIPSISRPYVFSKSTLMNILRRAIDLEKIKTQILSLGFMDSRGQGFK
jgi:dethiobiotin synthetase